jgi:antitoxin (DNA-binding transcriptional repressor) of toxin-antitoxin stability system
MAVTIQPEELQRRLEEVLARAAAGERFIVPAGEGREVELGPVAERVPAPPSGARRRHRGHRTIAEVLAEDRGA